LVFEINGKREAAIKLEDNNTVYDKLRDLYSKKSSLDSLTKGVAIEDIVRKLLRDIVDPFPENEDAAFFNRRFDGLISLGRGIDIIFEIKLGTLPDFELQRLMNYFFDIKLGRKLVLFIAYGLSSNGKSIFNKFKEKGLPISFIDFENLIELHKFVRYNIRADNSRILKVKKKYFLEELLKESNILNESFFNAANINAVHRFEESSAIKLAPTSALKTKLATSYTDSFAFETALKEEYDKRLEKLEHLARNLMEEIQALRELSEKEKLRQGSRNLK
jgi:hypothetical protein